MANYMKSKVQQAVSFLLILVIAFSAFSGVLFLNPSQSYAFEPKPFCRAIKGDKNLVNADLSVVNLSGAKLVGATLFDSRLDGAVANSYTQFPRSFNAERAGVIFDY
ncbi:MAG: pentapeptide repeat-containing protein [Pseudanabaena sp. Salubria-1]|jgi:uncharacterized protein YjbI with pentapeptide repeats|nr:pentapeptide repeat-containing protein [Pseudanabaena sp. Salubria-1]